MINATIHHISEELENFTKKGISLERALDIIEASTRSIEEIVAINVMRESMQETKKPTVFKTGSKTSKNPHTDQAA